MSLVINRRMTYDLPLIACLDGEKLALMMMRIEEALFQMPLLINGVPIEDAPRDLHAFYSQYPHFKESAAALCSLKPQVVGPLGLLYIFQREFAATHPHDNKITILGTDDVTTAHILVLRHTGNLVLTLARSLYLEPFH
jgi:hypothetical protein